MVSVPQNDDGIAWFGLRVNLLDGVQACDMPHVLTA